LWTCTGCDLFHLLRLDNPFFLKGYRAWVTRGSPETRAGMGLIWHSKLIKLISKLIKKINQYI
jgi:hypothetical protein